jgi:hypothetical protein
LQKTSLSVWGGFFIFIDIPGLKIFQSGCCYMEIVYIFGWEKEYKDLKLFRRAELFFL